MAVHDVANCNVYWSADDAPDSYVALPEATGFAFNSESEGGEAINTFTSRYVRTGTSTDSYTINALFDAVGQAAFRAAKRDGTPIFIALIWTDTPAAEAGQKQSCKILAYNIEADADGDYARASFTAEGEGALVEITVLP